MHWWFVDGETLNSSEVLLEEVSLGRIVGYASLCSAPGDAFRQESGTGVLRPSGGANAVAGCWPTYR